jgi:uncharacterized membrane protein
MNEARIGIALRIGVFGSAFITIIGILLIIVSHRTSLITHAHASSVVTAGLLLLIYMQVVRVFLTSWLFAERKEWLFFGCSIFILLLLSYSVFIKA